MKTVGFLYVKALIVSLLCIFSDALCDHDEKRFAIVITSYNNAEWYKANLDSVFNQEYSNYRIIYVDDASDDGTGELVEKYIIESGQQHRCTLIKNKYRVRALANIYNAVHLCDDEEIVFNFDGDDWLAHNQVFALINQLYQDPQVWITYGQFKNWPTEQMGYCKPLPDEVVQKQLYRQKWWAPGQLRTFYAWLFKKIHLKDLLFEGPYFQGQFFPANADLAIYYPMMEMAGHRHKFISEVIYIRNVQTPINDFKANKDVQVLGSALIRAKKKYPLLPLNYEHCKSNPDEDKADIVIVADNGPLAIDTVIKSIKNLVINYQTIHVITNNTHPYDQYKHMPGLKIHSFNDWSNLCSDLSEYVLLLSDSMIVGKCLNLSDCIREVKRTYAHGFYLAHDQHNTISYISGTPQPIPVLNRLSKDVYAWAFHYATRGDWREPFGLGMLAKKHHCLQFLLSFHNKEAIEDTPDVDSVGLCYHHPKIVFAVTKK
ncbi:hypothetical protein Noda2021_00640 [Candidatus Dependentiae bacterium Noda2021]|nr:hypothetical protein Noda2021_00640 [Candidatus Dependentiae bacterium Noda2021]